MQKCAQGTFSFSLDFPAVLCISERTEPRKLQFEAVPFPKVKAFFVPIERHDCGFLAGSGLIQYPCGNMPGRPRALF